jgi:hypothetical protein
MNPIMPLRQIKALRNAIQHALARQDDLQRDADIHGIIAGGAFSQRLFACCHVESCWRSFGM